jgi:type I restriction enzyme, R subunit
MTFAKESDFEDALIEALSHKGWEEKVIEYPSEDDLLRNWAAILFDNNREKDRLDNYPLTDSEMRQILEQITALRTPLKLSGFINGKTVSITRDNPDDRLHLGKEVSLKIYDRREIAAGQSRYQIARQPKFKSLSKILGDRRGDLMLLINGMPVIHIELKKSGVAVSQAFHQIEKYAAEGIFSGLFSLVQIFVAMEPEETRYFSNPGPEGRFNPDYYFRWADFNNEPINGWKDIASSLLSIPMAHQLIGFYTVADGSDGILKVMRSYQYYAANAISDRVSKIDWTGHDGRGGFVWHTTGSGKTMTSFKSAQLIANSKDADKVVFLVDRIELGTQSLREYRSFAEESEEVQATENTAVLIAKLKSSRPQDTLIVTSIQKMSNIQEEDGGINARDLEHMQGKRIVIIVDEAHRSTFGDMLRTIKSTFPRALLFGFTGTPIQEENQRRDNTTSSIFGNELHRYSIADGIRDKNVLGFDPYKVLTYKDRDLRLAVALEQAKAEDEVQALSDPAKKLVFNKFMKEAAMAGRVNDDGSYSKGIEDHLPSAQYDRKEHREKVVEDILDNWLVLSQNGKYHALLATSSIAEAIEYFRLFKSQKPDLKVTALFDPNIDNDGGVQFKEDGLVEIIEDYNARYERDFTLPGHDLLKKDIAARLAHKEPHIRIETSPEKQIDLLIVVDQMLTGFDSKWINTLYMDKLLQYEGIIQAFSRTNRLFGPDKPFGTIRYYRKPHTMEENINKAVKLYSGDKPLALFVDRLDSNLRKLNSVYQEIAELFARSGVADLSKLPEDKAERGKFAKLFRELNLRLESAKIQGFTWSRSRYEFSNGSGKQKTIIDMSIDENDYLVLALRYKELSSGGDAGGSDGGSIPDVPYDIDGYLTEIDTGKIDADYMNSRFDKYLRSLSQEGIDEKQKQETLDDLHKSFAYLSAEEQKYANLFLHDVERGYAVMASGKNFRDYVTDYRCKAKNDQIGALAKALGLDETKLRGMMGIGLSEASINEFGRFDELKDTVDRAKAKAYFEGLGGSAIAPFQVNIRVHELLQKFILNGGFDI